MNTDADLGVMRQDPHRTGKPGRFKAWRGFMKWYLGGCLLVGVPVVWALGVMAYMGRFGLVVLGFEVKELPSLLLLVCTGPVAVIIISLVLWVLLILPAQVLWWGGRWTYRATVTWRHHSSPPATGA